MKNTIVILDDNQKNADKTKFIVYKFFQDIVNSTGCEILIYNDEDKLLNEIQNKKLIPMMIFCDVDMGTDKVKGVEIAKQINLLAPRSHIVYLTNKLKYVSEIFQTEHLYYVLKDELEKKLPEIYIKMINKNKEFQKMLRIEGRKNQFIAIRYADIIYIERKGRVTFIHGNKEDWETYLSLNQLEEIIEDQGIVRCHNSYMVSMKYIKTYIRELCTMINGDKIPISRKYQPIFKTLFVSWSKNQI